MKILIQYVIALSDGGRYGPRACLLFLCYLLVFPKTMPTQTVVKRTHTREEQERNANTHNIAGQNELESAAKRRRSQVSTTLQRTHVRSSREHVCNDLPMHLIAVRF